LPLPLQGAPIIKFDNVATISKDLIEGEIGNIDDRLAGECNTLMSRIFIF